MRVEGTKRSVGSAKRNRVGGMKRSGTGERRKHVAKGKKRFVANRKKRLVESVQKRFFVANRKRRLVGSVQKKRFVANKKKRLVSSVQKKKKLNGGGKLSLLASRRALIRRLPTLLLLVLNLKRKKPSVAGRKKQILPLHGVHRKKASKSTGLLRNGNGKKNWTVSLPVVSRRMRRSVGGRWRRWTGKWLGNWILSSILERRVVVRVLGGRLRLQSFLLAEERVVPGMHLEGGK